MTDSSWSSAGYFSGGSLFPARRLQPLQIGIRRNLQERALLRQASGKCKPMAREIVALK
jgi:hypothetical protein